MNNDKQVVRNRYCFGLETIGRDMLYSLVSMYLINFITGVISVSNKGLGMITSGLLTILLFSNNRPGDV